MEKIKKFSLKTLEGSRRVFAVALAVLFLFSFVAYILSVDFGNVKVNEVAIDSRGSVMQGTLYTPRNTNSEDALPGVIITHGLSCNHNAVNGLAEELARRGFAVLSVSTYGSGTSETSDMSDPSYGMYDALQYFRTLNYVDQTRVGMMGHSQGSKNTSAAIDMDSSLFTLNDLKLNILFDTFGQSFTADEIQQDADALASARLTASELSAYKVLAADAETYFNTRLKSAIILGGNWGSEAQTVSVAGHDVVREVNTNILYEIATFNEGRAGTGQQNLSKPEMMAKFGTTEEIVPCQWYNLDQLTNPEVATSAVIGNLKTDSYTSSTSLQAAIESRTTRMMVNQVNGHARDYFSSDAARYVVKYFEQTLQYTPDNLASAAVPVAFDDIGIRFILREAFNLFSLFALCVSVVALAGMMMATKTFASLKQDVSEPFTSKKSYGFWISAALLVLASMYAEYTVATKGPMLGFKQEWVKHLLSLDFTANIHLVFMWIVAGLSLVVMLLFAFLTKKAENVNMFTSLKLNSSFKKVMGYLGASVLLVAYAYIAAAVVKYFFHQDLRLWDIGIKDMLPEQWALVFRYAVVIFPTCLVSAMMVNAGRMKDMKECTNTILMMVITSIGLYVLAAYSYGNCYITYFSTGIGNAPAIAFISTWGMLVALPLLAYLNRKFYQLSGSVWLGAFFNTWLIAWMTVSGQSQTGYYLLTNFASKWLGIF